MNDYNFVIIKVRCLWDVFIGRRITFWIHITLHGWSFCT